MSRIYFIMNGAVDLLRRFQELHELCGDVTTKIVADNGVYVSHLDWSEPVALFEVPASTPFPSRFVRRINDPLIGDAARGIVVPDRLLSFFDGKPFTAFAVREGSAAETPALRQVPCRHGQDTVMLHPLTVALRDIHLRSLTAGTWLGPKHKRPSRLEPWRKRRAERARHSGASPAYA